MSTHLTIKNENRPNPRTATSEKKGDMICFVVKSENLWKGVCEADYCNHVPMVYAAIYMLYQYVELHMHTVFKGSQLDAFSP